MSSSRGRGGDGQRIVDVSVVSLSEEDVWTASAETSPEEKQFDDVVGTLEDLIMDDRFVELQQSFMERNCHHFSNDDENKLEYMEIFHNYTLTVETFIESKLRQQLPWFSMADFLAMIRSRSDQVDGEVFEILSSLADFSLFKDMIMSYKQEKEGAGLDLSGLITVSSSKR